MNKIRKAVATLMLMSSVNPVRLGDIFCCHRRGATTMERLQSEHNELMGRSHGIRGQGAATTLRIRQYATEMEQNIQTMILEWEEGEGFISIPTDQGTSKTMLPAIQMTGCSSIDNYWTISHEFSKSDGQHDYTAKIAITNPSQANGARPLEISAEIQRRMFLLNGEVQTGILLLDYKNGQWKNRLSGDHDPVWDEVTRRFSVSVIELDGTRWNASARTGFILR